MTIAGFFAPWLIHGAVLLLHLALPARNVDGYVTDADTGRPLRYRLNGLVVLGLAIAAWWGLGRADLVPLDWLHRHRWDGVAGAVALGLAFTLAVVLPAPPTGKGLLADLYLGRLENPQWFGRRLDAKMILYLVGAVLLALNLLSSAAFHRAQHPEAPSPGVALHLALFLWFLVDYLTFERVHLWTYDFVAERVGFKLGWGCIAFYPYFYAVGLSAVADLPDPGCSPLWRAASAIVFFAGWALARGANLQKFTFKTEPERAFLGVFVPETITDGQRTLLVSGFWRVSRHVNYLGEFLMATGLTLALGWPGAWAPWLYPLYYVALLVPRQIDDDARCKARYGPLWDEYCARVRWRIVPGIY